MKSERTKGYIYALIATIAFSNVYIFSKAALNQIHLSQFGIYWFAIGLMLNAIIAFRTKRIRQFLSFQLKDFKLFVLLGIMEIITTTLFFISINMIADPAVTSFLGNMYPVLLVFMGIIFLKEHFTKLESAGAILALAGAFIISYQGGTDWSKLFLPGTGIVLLNAIFASSTSIIVKKNIHNYSPELVNFNRTLWLFIYSVGVFIYFGKPLEIPVSALGNIAIGGTLGPFLGILTAYRSFKYIEASRSSVVQSLKGIFVLLGALMYFGTLPASYQLIGGLLTVLGVMIVSLSQANLLKLKRK